MKNEQKHFCLNCSHEQGYVGAISDYIYCERCGAKIHAGGSNSCEGTREWYEQSKEQADRYDSNFRKP